MTLYIENYKYLKPNPNDARLFVGRDGHTYISDKFGTHRASALAIAMLQRPPHRAAGYREDCDNA